MAKGKLTDKQKKQIIADYVDSNSYSESARRNGISETTARRVVKGDPETTEKVEHKKLENTKDMMQHLANESKRAQSVVSLCLEVLSNPDKLKAAQPQQVSTVMGTVIDKFANVAPPDDEENKVFTADALLIADGFARIRRDILNHGHSEYVLPGGRGSTKSSFISLMVIELLENNPNMHALALRRFENTLEESVFNQLVWAIHAHGLESKYKWSRRPCRIVRKDTEQTIFFRGADKPEKIKSIKPKKGAIGILWFEELDQFQGPAAIRSIEQSALRGIDIAWNFKSFNTPKTKDNWANKECEIPNPKRLLFRSNYKSAMVPEEWLGRDFLDRAEHLAEVNPKAYEHEYEGIANGVGGTVFENVTIRAITDEEIRRFDRIYNGVDWGFYPDPWAFNRCHFEASTRRLCIFDEGHEYKKIPAETGKIVARKTRPKEKITCDSSPPENTHDYMRQGLVANRAIKGPGSVERRHVWLQGLTEIIIDPARCPYTAEEFTNYEHDKDQDGNIIGGYPDRDNHHIDAVCYGCEDLWHIAEQRSKSLTDYL